MAVPSRAAIVVGLIVLLTVPTNVLRTLEDIAETGDHPQDLNWFSAYWPQANSNATAWIRAHTPPDAAFFCTPLSGRYIAATAGRAVYAGHWGETPRFSERISVTVDFFSKPQSPDERLLQLHTCATNYIFRAPGAARRTVGPLSRSGIAEGLRRGRRHDLPGKSLITAAAPARCAPAGDRGDRGSRQ